jgi:hypothetical protein
MTMADSKAFLIVGRSSASLVVILRPSSNPTLKFGFAKWSNHVVKLMGPADPRLLRACRALNKNLSYTNSKVKKSIVKVVNW